MTLSSRSLGASFRLFSAKVPLALQRFGRIWFLSPQKTLKPDQKDLKPMSFPKGSAQYAQHRQSLDINVFIVLVLI